MSKTQEISHVNLDGIRVFPFASVDSLIDFAMSRKGILVAVNAEKMMNSDDTLRAIINKNIGYCDGGGAVLACRQAGFDSVRIPGCELWLEIIKRFHSTASFYLVGSRQEVIDATVSKLKEMYPGLKICGYRDGFILSESDREKLIEDIASLKPDVVFVAMGSPRQEILMDEMMKVHPALYQGLGGSFDVFTGLQKRAPLWWQRHNCEFLYRLLSHPHRLFRNRAQMRLTFRLLMKKYAPSK